MICQFAYKFSSENDGFEEGAFAPLNGDRRFLYVERWVGKVIRLIEKGYRDDSDYYALVWDDETGKPMKVLYATTRAYSYGCHAVVDATQEVLDKYKNYLSCVEQRNTEYEYQKSFFVPKIGSLVKSLITRGKAKGIEGHVTHIRKTAYDCLVTVNDVSIPLNRCRIWHTDKKEWVRPASWCATLNMWSVTEVQVPFKKI
jgi:hypothetical protein